MIGVTWLLIDDIIGNGEQHRRHFQAKCFCCLEVDHEFELGRQLSKAEALDRAEALRPVLAELAGRSHRDAAQALNVRGITTAEGKPWHAMQVVRVRRRLGL
jgi:hypothetical protein